MEPGSPTPVVEETQQTTPVGMDIDMPEVGQANRPRIQEILHALKTLKKPRGLMGWSQTRQK
jgi:hypothetical protein